WDSNPRIPCGYYWNSSPAPSTARPPLPGGEAYRRPPAPATEVRSGLLRVRMFLPERRRMVEAGAGFWRQVRRVHVRDLERILGIRQVGARRPAPRSRLLGG